MNLLGSIRPMLRIAKALEEIARALSYFAVQHAKENGQIYMLTRPNRFGKDESELLHTDGRAIRQRQAEEWARFVHEGYPGIEADDEIDM